MSKLTMTGIAAVATVVAVAGAYILLFHSTKTVAETVEVQAASSAASVVDVEKSLILREMGDKNAPVTIQEFASLTCSHCAHFHKDTLSKLKEAYIDTGKVRFIFTDYPLNAPALDAAMISRCLPEDRYFKFLSFLFETQDQWAYSSDYRKNLKQGGKLLGGTEEMLDACLNNEALKKGLVDRMQKAAQDHSIESTPSFLINGTELLKGAQPFPVFQEKIDALLNESKSAE